MLELKNLTKTFRTSEIETAALSNVNVKIEQGEFVAVMGPSGCGKSTLLNIIGMLDTPTSGEYQFLDQEVSSTSLPHLLLAIRHNSSWLLSLPS